MKMGRARCEAVCVCVSDTVVEDFEKELFGDMMDDELCVQVGRLVLL
jgi:hypothetical protein